MAPFKLTKESASILMVLAIACAPDSAASEGLNPVKLQEFTKAIAATVGSQLGTHLSADGPAQTVAFCSEHVSEIVKGAIAINSDKLYGYTVTSFRRVTDRPRNPANRATGRELDLLAELGSEVDANTELGQPNLAPPSRLIEDSPVKGGITYYQAIVMAPICLTCHGALSEQSADLRAAIAARYPQDAAVGYRIGDLRGAFRIELRPISDLK